MKKALLFGIGRHDDGKLRQPDGSRHPNMGSARTSGRKIKKRRPDGTGKMVKKDCISQYGLRDTPLRMKALNEVDSKLTRFNYYYLYYYE